MGKRPRQPKNPNPHQGGPCRAWNADGTPFTPAQYRKAGLPVPTEYQLALWAAADAQRLAERVTQGRSRRS